MPIAERGQTERHAEQPVHIHLSLQMSMQVPPNF